MRANTIFLRLEGPLQAWGDQQSKFVVRRTSEAPTKSGVIGMLCAALGVSRALASEKWLPELAALRMGVRIDSPGFRWWDFHTVGAGISMSTAGGDKKSESEAMLTKREYLCDASFLVVLQGEESLIDKLEGAMRKPAWTLYLGRKACPPSRPLLEHPSGCYSDLLSAIKAIPWAPRYKNDNPTEYVDNPPDCVECLLDWEPEPGQPEAPENALIWYDVPLTFDPPYHGPRFVIKKELKVGASGDIKISDKPVQNEVPSPPRIRADYGNSEFRYRRKERLAQDYHLCVFCKSPANTVQHITYKRAGGNELLDDLRSLCRLCHDAVTMIEYGMNMGMDRINPEEPRWREAIIRKRDEIIRFRSIETRRRRLSAEEV
jgi:CRISPR system Cascade subunit CasD